MKLAVIYESVTGNTKQAAAWIAEGMNEIEGVDARCFPIEEVDEAFVKEAMGIVIGCPSYMASMTPNMRAWLMKAARLGMAGKLGGAFATEQYTHGGGELVIQSILTNELVFGMLCYLRFIVCFTFWFYEPGRTFKNCKSVHSGCFGTRCRALGGMVDECRLDYSGTFQLAFLDHDYSANATKHGRKRNFP